MYSFEDEMPVTEYFEWLTYFEVVAEEEKAAREKSRSKRGKK